MPESEFERETEATQDAQAQAAKAEYEAKKAAGTLTPEDVDPLPDVEG